MRASLLNVVSILRSEENLVWKCAYRPIFRRKLQVRCSNGLFNVSWKIFTIATKILWV